MVKAICVIKQLTSDEAPLTIVFIDRENTARSQMAEAILRSRSRGRVRSFSAGLEPGGEVDDDALGSLAAARVSTEGLTPKPIDTCMGPEAPAFDFVITVCDDAADAIVEAWSGPGRHVHWPMENPATMSGSRRVAFDHVRRKLEAAIDNLIRSARADPLVLARLARDAADERGDVSD